MRLPGAPRVLLYIGLAFYLAGRFQSPNRFAWTSIIVTYAVAFVFIFTVDAKIYAWIVLADFYTSHVRFLFPMWRKRQRFFVSAFMTCLLALDASWQRGSSEVEMVWVHLICLGIAVMQWPKTFWMLNVLRAWAIVACGWTVALLSGVGTDTFAVFTPLVLCGLYYLLQDEVGWR